MRDDTAVVPHKGPMLQNSESPKTLNEKMKVLTTIFSTHKSMYIGSMKELFLLYSSNIDIKKNGFTYGSISLHMQFDKHTSSQDIAMLNTVFYARTVNEENQHVEIADAAELIDLNVDELLRENTPTSDLDIPSFGTRSGIVTSDDPINVYQVIKDSQLDATKLFITLNKEGEDKFSVTKLDDFLGECLKAAQEALVQADASDKKKKKAANLQSSDQANGSQTSGSQASGSQASSTQRNAQEPKKNRKTLMDEFKQSLVSKDMAKCKESAKLLMANSTVSSLMYLFVLIALGICLL
ncbi:Uncharacterized protein PCOAH_00034820 [Plasmodium coatneyi]|uniref:Uncharacterized protein n=1 Tax=Plasmodium coatneyi TaxID=208452 RepID=A0A1B1E221_9APIC|nr:Uncharacterized protein PCOAH_00034820 [Plasmodium coatneyi]ANQ09005.1 Uncharacterized protein PCOAH_00034820 [Plasmodium coatneyi]